MQTMKIIYGIINFEEQMLGKDIKFHASDIWQL